MRISSFWSVTLTLALALVLASPAVFAQGDPFIGTWVMNVAKSQFVPGTQPDSMTLVVSDAGDGKLKSVSDLSMGGLAIHGEVTFAVDGRDYVPISTPAPPPGVAVSQSNERVSDGVYKTTVKVNGQVITTLLNELSEDGQTLTVSSTGAGPAAGASSVMVFDRQ